MDAKEVLPSLSASQIREQLAELSGEEEALKVLLRATLRREQVKKRMTAPAARQPEGAGHDS